MATGGDCQVDLVGQHSKQPCLRGVSFGCTGSQSIWTRACRGEFRCGINNPSFPCGYPPGRSSYDCSCPSPSQGRASTSQGRAALWFLQERVEELHALPRSAGGFATEPVGELDRWQQEERRALPPEAGALFLAKGSTSPRTCLVVDESAHDLPQRENGEASMHKADIVVQWSARSQLLPIRGRWLTVRVHTTWPVRASAANGTLDAIVCPRASLPWISGCWSRIATSRMIIRFSPRAAEALTAASHLGRRVPTPSSTTVGGAQLAIGVALEACKESVLVSGFGFDDAPPRVRDWLHELEALGRVTWQRGRRHCPLPPPPPAMPTSIAASLPTSTAIVPSSAALAASATRLQVAKNPMLVLPRFWSAARADAAKAEVLAALDGCSIRGSGGDRRSFGVERAHSWGWGHASTAIRAFTHDKLLADAVHAFLNTSRPRVQSLALGGFVNGPDQDSGGGWHQDAPWRGIKALMYLDDVREPADCAFAMLRHYRPGRLRPLARSKRPGYSEAAVEAEVARGARVEAVLAPRGSVVLFDTSSVHRGLPCGIGRNRTTLTTYYANPMPRCEPSKRYCASRKKS